MKKNLLPLGTLGIAGFVTVGLLALPTSVSANADDDFAKREDDLPELVLVSDDDDDDTADRDSRGDDTSRSSATRSRDTGNSRSRDDNTNSRKTAVSRDRDLSRGDKTRDWTKDGAKKKGKDQIRDWSANRTNDRSRNDTRG